MRKVISILVTVFTMAFSSVTFAYPAHLNGDSNYILCDGNKGIGYYVDRSSLNVKQYTPPTYIIAINVVRVPDADMGKTKISDVKTYYFLYKYNDREMYVPSEKSSDYDWRLLKPHGSYAETGISMPAGEIAFYLAYNLRFYGERAGYDNSFYNKI